MNIITMVLNLIFPKVCLGCGEFGRYICPRCQYRKLQFQYLHVCHVCKQETFLSLVHVGCAEETYLDGVVIAYFYNDFVETVIKEVKYHFHFAILDELGQLLASVFKDYQLPIEAVTAIPLHATKEKWRGFNQAELLARHVAQNINVPYCKLLSRTRNTQTQVGKDRAQRLANLNEAFAAINIGFNNVLLVDDVMTTGTTLEQCAKELKLKGVEKIYGLVFARGS